MKKNYIKMNNYKHLSLGNVINVIKEISNNKNVSQTEIFCSIFGINNINSTTVNNYCIGIRAIGLEYKNIFEDNYISDNLKENILSILNIIDNKIYNDQKIINTSNSLSKVIEKLLEIASQDEHIQDTNIFLKENNYKTIKELLYYAIIKNKQPIYTQDINIKIDKYELNEYMKLELYWGQSYISSLIELANKNNMYACAKLGSLEYEGEITGYPNYQKSYEYYLKSANKNHPKSCWMISNLILSNKVEYDFETMWKYLNKSIELGSAAGYNTKGICYLKGINKDNKIDIEKAEYYFKVASDLGYVFAFNNLGKIYENINEEESLKYYKISADMNNSWALNKVGEYYRKNNDLKTAFIYYNKAIECPIKEICRFAYYNLAEYYYKIGNKELNIKKDDKKANIYYDKFNNI
jgi:TPR repeat protein